MTEPLEFYEDVRDTRLLTEILHVRQVVLGDPSRHEVSPGCLVDHIEIEDVGDGALE